MRILANNFFDHVAEHGFWPDDATLPLRPMLVVASVVLGLLLARQGWLAWGRWRVKLAPLRAYRDVARQARLGWADQWWLWRLARRQQLASPLTLLVCDATLAHHAQQVAQRLHGGEQRRWQWRSEQIRQALFGGTG